MGNAGSNWSLLSVTDTNSLSIVTSSYVSTDLLWIISADLERIITETINQQKLYSVCILSVLSSEAHESLA